MASVERRDTDPVTIWAPDTIIQTTRGRLADLVRTGGISWHHEHNPDWRDKPWMDGIVVDLDEADVVDAIVDYIITHANPPDVDGADGER